MFLSFYKTDIPIDILNGRDTTNMVALLNLRIEITIL